MLALAYAVAPVLALAVGGGLSGVEASDGVAVAAASTLFLAPMGVHLYHGAGVRAVRSFGSMVAMTLVGTIVGGGVGYLENQITCDSERDSECRDGGIGTTIAGAAAGGIVGYVVSAVVDVACCSSAPEHARSTTAALVWVAPLSGAARGLGVGDRRRSAGGLPFEDGIMLGVTLSL